MMDFLEHLPSLEHATNVLIHAAEAAHDFLFIRHRSLEDVEFLAEHDLKLTWTDWSGHTNMMRISDFESLFAAHSLSDYVLIPRKKIETSMDDVIVPSQAPTDTIRYSVEEHGYKKFKIFDDHNVFAQFDIFVRLNEDIDDGRWHEIIGPSFEGYPALSRAIDKVPRQERSR